MASSSTQDKVLITGAQGFFGAHIIKQLLELGSKPYVMDLSENQAIFKQVLTEEQVAALDCTYCNISDASAVLETVLKIEPTSIIHLAGLQIPTCKAKPGLGATVNVIGTINVFEAAKALAEKTGKPPPMIVYASSAAVLGPPGDYKETPVPDDVYHKPRTLYGVFKIANEGTARIYFQDHKINSVGLRPLTCFGVGREVGMTSYPTKAIKAILLGRETYEIPFSGVTGFSYVKDIAKIFIGCTKSPRAGAECYNIRGDMVSVEHFVEELVKVMPEAKDKIKISGPEIPIMSDVDESGLVSLLASLPAPYGITQPFPTPLGVCITETAADFKKLAEEGRLNDKDL